MLKGINFGKEALPLKRLLVYLTNYKKECIVAPAFKLLEALFDLFVPLVMAGIIDVGIPAGDGQYILRKCGLLVLLGIVGLVCSLIAQYFAARAATGFSAGVRRALFAHIQTLSAAQRDGIGTAALLTRMTSDVNQVQNGVNMALRLFLRSPFIVFGALIMAFFIDLRCALVMACAIAALFLIVFAIMALTIPGQREVQSRLDTVTRRTRENLTGVRVVRAFHRQAEETARFRSANDALTAGQLRVGRISALMNPLTYAAINLGVVLILWLGGISIDAGTLRPGDVIALVNYMSQVLVELIKLASTLVLVTRSLASARRISSVLDLPARENNGTAQTQPQAAAVAFDHVSLTYPGSDRESLFDLSFTALRGQTIGVIGSTGSGKTSLINLISRLYDCSAGCVSVFGQAVETLDAAQLHQTVAVVPQKPQLFRGTIRSNLTFSAPAASDEALWQALEWAQAADFVRARPLGLEERVEQGGRNLSGGQRQRLTIARALVTRAPILILDDSASALDYATDAALRRALTGLPWEPTLFLVSQRASSLRYADQILVLEDGALAGQGTHEELLDTCPVYREIWDSQTGGDGHA